MDILDIIDEAINKVEQAVHQLPRVRADEIGLDRRAGFVYVDTDNQVIIAESGHIRSLEYYGGFEYIDDDCTQTIGQFKIYGVEETSRVRDAIKFYLKEDEEEE